ncbi:MAG: hypothetical protein M3Q69_07810 [Acidobacteriota bacterium]|nr:hypothetical protein [Acidobacteriota bacterium]
MKRALFLLFLSLPLYAADEVTIKLGGVLFADYVWQASPETRDAEGNAIHANAFNVTRAYININGTVGKRIAFRITPDIARESGSGSSLSGSQNFRLKFAFAQLNLDEWATKGSWVRLGVQQTPYVDYTETIYRYRFQGPVFVDREGYLSASDAGLSARYVFPGDYGDVHAGFYNGETFARPEQNDEKALQMRVSLRPLPRNAFWKGLRGALFADADHYIGDAKRQRLIAQATFEHPRVVTGLELVSTKDRPTSIAREVEGRGYSAWATPRLGDGWELLLRHDDLRPDDASQVRRRRNIAGVAYWVPNLDKVTSAVMLDYDSLSVTGRERETRYGVKLLLSF